MCETLKQFEVKLKNMRVERECDEVLAPVWACDRAALR